MIPCRPPRRSRALALVLILLPSAPARADDRASVTLPGESRAAALRLEDARKLLNDHKWSQAIEQLQAIINTADGDLVAVTPNHSVRAGRLCRIQLASLPADALRLYRQRYETQARKKLQQAQTERDGEQLRKLVETSFCTRAAEKAIDLLGDLAFERGRFAEAEEWWRLLAPLPDSRRDAAVRGLALVYPDLSLDPARVQAKQLLARLFRGADREWTAALEAFAERHAKAEGALAGRKGRYVDLLRTLAEQRRKQGDGEREDWRTFAGDPSRGRRIPAEEDILDHLSGLCREGPTWTFNLAERVRQEDAEPSPAVNAAQARTLAFHPIIVGPRVILSDARHVTAFDLRNGQSEKWYDVAQNNGGVQVTSRVPAPPDLRYTLTAADDRVYVRLGAQDVGLEAAAQPPAAGQPAKPRRDNETFLSCLSLRPDVEGKHFRREIRGIAEDNALFEGSPLVAEGLMWIASTRYRGDHCHSAIDCYTAEDTSGPPLRWRCDVCETSEVKLGEPRYRHHLLTRAGSQIVYCTHTGAVVAVDARTGRRSWAVRYPRRTSGKEEIALRDLTPVLFAADRLFVAPADSDSLLCLDPASGRTLWEVESVRVVHLLGVGQGRLIFTTPTSLRAIHVADGNLAWAVPDTAGGELLSDGLTPAGRGLLIGDVVLFPTTQKRDPSSPRIEGVVYALRQSDGRPADDPAKLHRLPAGNLAYANGCLAVADRQTLFVFVPPRLLLAERKAEARRRPDPATLLQLARAEADAGHVEEALQTLRRAESGLRDLPASRRSRLLHRLRAQRQRLYLDLARDAAAAHRWEDAETALERASAVPMPPRGRLHALLRAAQIWRDAGQGERAEAVWQTIRRDETLRDISVIDRSGKPGLAGTIARRDTGPTRETDRREADSRQPALPLFRSWHTRLARDEWILDGWQECDPELLLTGSPDGRFTCRLTASGEVRWQHRLPFGPRWATCRAESLLVGGDEGAACLRRDNGELLWHFPAPAAGRYPRGSQDAVRVVLDPQPPEPLTDFRQAAGRLFFLQGQRRLFAVNAETGAVLWDRWAPDAGLRLPSPRSRFSPCYHADSETVLVQAFGRRWLLDAATGRTIHEAADSHALWQRPPLAVDERTLCVTQDSRHITLLDARTGKGLWEHHIAGSSMLSGEVPLVLGRGEVLLCVQPANVGYYLQRLDRATGKAVWPRPQLLAARMLDPDAWPFDSQAVYTIEDRFLTARTLTDGRLLWRRQLPSGERSFLPIAGWQVRRIGDYLAVVPQASPAEVRLQFRSPLGAVQWKVGSLLSPDAVSPVSCYDPKTGQLVQRWNCRIGSPVRTAIHTAKNPDESGRLRTMQTSSLLASERGPVVRLASPRPFVAVGGEVWGLTTTPDALAGAASPGR